MLNVVSRSAGTKQIGGQIKVFRNLIKGLEKINYPFVVNRRLDACERLWIHDEIRALPLVSKLPPEIKVVVGPNLYVMPRDMPRGLDLQRVIYLHPCQWSIGLWEAHGFKDWPTKIVPPMRAWPVGIETDLFAPSPHENREHVLIYHKHRAPEELAQIISIVERAGLKYQTIIYGDYKQDDYLRHLSRSRYIIWHGRHESQGIALQEAMACDVPILLCDVTKLKQFWTGGGGCYVFNESEKEFPLTAAPYFDQTCGLRIETLSELEAGISHMEAHWREFRPRDYVLQNLSLEKQARELLELYSYWGLEVGESNQRAQLKSGKWRPPISWVVPATVRRVKGYLNR